MTNVVHLNKKRKAVTRDKKETRASENRLKYGRTKKDRLADALKEKKLALHVQAYKRETNDE